MGGLVPVTGGLCINNVCSNILQSLYCTVLYCTVLYCNVMVPVTGGLCTNNAGSLYAVCSNILKPDIRNISSAPQIDI